MLSMYLGFLTLGVLFAIFSVLFGDLIGDALDGLFDFISVDFLNPAVLAGGVTVFGGAGMLLTRYSSLGTGAAAAASLIAAVFAGILMYFGFVKPMDKSEVSSGFSVSELPGKIGEVTVPVPARGFGEVMVKFGAANTLHTAASFDRLDLPVGIKVVVVEIKEGVALVSGLEERRGEDV